MLRVIRMELEYEGTAYSGFGLQPGLPTIQGTVEGVLAGILGHPVRVTPGGRTDAGVHARGQVISFRTEARLAVDAISRAANAVLPEDILAGLSEEAEPGFDARRSARSRWYRYTVLNRERPDLWQRRYVLHHPGSLDERAMNQAANQLVGRLDLASFIGHASQQPQPVTTVRTIYHATWTRDGELLHFDCRANAFARHVVRNVVGTLLWVGRGRLSADDFCHVLEARDRRVGGPTAPARGLTLMRVNYDDQESLS